MALVTNILHQALQRDVAHTVVNCTYEVVTNASGKHLQLDTYGASGRQLKGKKSQSIRLSPSAIDQLKKIILRHGL